MKKTYIKNRKFLHIFLWSVLLVLTGTAWSIPETGFQNHEFLDENVLFYYPEPYKLDSEETKPRVAEQGLQNVSLENFVMQVIDGNQKSIRGVYSNGVLAFPVIQQPAGQPGYVSSVEGVVTEFSMASSQGVTGLLAHNYLSGRFFHDFELGDVIQIVYGDGTIRKYQVSDLRKYQALQPNSTNSRFVDLDSDQELSATELFKLVYRGNHHLTLQTCIQVGEIDSWGRLFIIADPI